MSDYLFQHSELIGSGYLQGKLFKVSWYPGAVLSEDQSDKVHGSVFKLANNEFVIKKLDEYEGIEEGLYKRESVKVVLKDNSDIKCWVYLYNQSTENLKQILSGNFLEP